MEPYSACQKGSNYEQLRRDDVPRPRIEDNDSTPEETKPYGTDSKLTKWPPPSQAKPSQVLSMLRSAFAMEISQELGFPHENRTETGEFQSQAIKAASNQALGSFHFRPAHCPRHPLVCLFGSICSFASTTWFSTLILLPCKVLSHQSGTKYLV